jgi:hypothetical protein
VYVFLKIAFLADCGSHQFRFLRGGRNNRQVAVHFALEFGIGKELDQLGTADFSMPLTQRAPYSVAMIAHEMFTSKQDFEGPWAGDQNANP